MSDAAPCTPEKGGTETAERRRRPGWWTIAGVLAAGVVVAVVIAVFDAHRPVERQRPPAELRIAPPFELENVRAGEPRIQLADHAGEPVVLNFWASWCPPCIREMPAFEEVHREMEDRVVFLGVNHQDLRDEALDLLAMTRVTYPSGYDPSGDTALDYGLVGMPTTVFISADGEILSVNTGELSGDGLRQSIRMLFAT